MLSLIQSAPRVSRCRARREQLKTFIRKPLLSEYCPCKTVEARFWFQLEPFSERKVDCRYPCRYRAREGGGWGGARGGEI